MHTFTWHHVTQPFSEYRKFNRHFSAGPSGVQPLKTPPGHPSVARRRRDSRAKMPFKIPIPVRGCASSLGITPLEEDEERLVASGVTTACCRRTLPHLSLSNTAVSGGIVSASVESRLISAFQINHDPLLVSTEEQGECRQCLIYVDSVRPFLDL
jgi:hypothetical protein